MNGLRLTGPIVATSNAFNCNARFTSFMSLGHLNNVVIGNAALRRHRNGPCPHVTRAPTNVLGTIKLRGGNISCFYRRVCPAVGSCGARVVIGIDNSTVRSCITATRHVGTLRTVPTVRLGVSYPGIGRNNVTFNIATGKTRRMIHTIHRICSGALVIGLSPGIASVARVTHTTRTTNTSDISLVGALLNVTVSTRHHHPLLSAIANNVDNPTMGPVTLHVI